MSNDYNWFSVTSGTDHKGEHVIVVFYLTSERPADLDEVEAFVLYSRMGEYAQSLDYAKFSVRFAAWALYQAFVFYDHLAVLNMERMERIWRFLESTEEADERERERVLAGETYRSRMKDINVAF